MPLDRKFTSLALVIFLFSVCPTPSTHAYDCQVFLQDKEITSTDWASLEPCLGLANSEDISANTSENIWRLIKIAFDGVENVPPEVYGKIRLVLTAITNEELHNISMARVEIVEAFGGVHALNSGDTNKGFTDEQIKLIARKVRTEWLGKRPETYSEYDLVSMGEIACHLNASDIFNIHADAFKAAAESIGSIESCPETQLQAFAKLALRKEAFGEAKDWSKIVVSLVGNIVNGLSQPDMIAIDESKLKLNQFYAQKKKKKSHKGQKRHVENGEEQEKSTKRRTSH
ncbi:uncharacterized protein LOC118750557 [Rhagoletis pomonella]|uniref:uncharacterized protein LOC118750427 n=1 Tax=Rhagoletis pomonella TaxID=28610 RepID=UPI0017877017|nr:uncharacterized protein LOC118750427 [Rhagoletis pomonella]XP_036341173.1 uncharacterized protein LOC118750551 [Rhagoletis pomonella]XP_036341184.1 uncharacterized protein LOC118750557 [Rhagoletis pomonella]